MTVALIKDLAQFKDQEVQIRGWVNNVRSSGSLFFLQMRDGSGFAQAIVSQSDVSDDVWQAAETITQETSVKLTGRVAQHPKKEDVFELQVSDVEVVQVAVDYPISNKEHGPDFLLDNRHLWLRSKKQWAIQRVRNTIINALFEYLNDNAFIKIDSPILTPNACEGTTELFDIEYFDDKKAYLSQSGQLYLEAAIAAHGRVFDFGPVFRAEKSKTRRHLIEFWMLDAEMAFFEHADNMDLQEGLIQHVITRVLEKNAAEFALLERDVEPLKKALGPFIRKTHTEVVAELQAMGSDIKDGEDLGADDEKMLMSKYEQPMFVEKYPRAVKAFYMKPDPENPDLALCSDLLAPEGYGEVIGGSEREDDYDKLLEYIKAHDLDPEVFSWYLDARKYGSVPHSGFGIGLERLVAWICGVKHVRETIPFPRLINRIQP